MGWFISGIRVIKDLVQTRKDYEIGKLVNRINRENEPKDSWGWWLTKGFAKSILLAKSKPHEKKQPPARVEEKTPPILIKSLNCDPVDCSSENSDARSYLLMFLALVILAVVVFYGVEFFL